MWVQCDAVETRSIFSQYSHKVAFTLGAISRRDVAARWTLKMGYKDINRVVYTRRDVAGRHNDATPEMPPAPILSRRSATSPQIL